MGTMRPTTGCCPGSGRRSARLCSGSPRSGIDVVNDGEYGKAMRSAVDFGAWWSYVYDGSKGLSCARNTQSRAGRAWTFGSKERKDFAEFMPRRQALGRSASSSGAAATKAVPAPHDSTASPAPGQSNMLATLAIKRDVENLASTVVHARVEETFMTAVSPATLQILPKVHYKSREDYTLALAEAIHEEYKAIVDAGFILQIDDPALVDMYDWWYSLNDDMAGYRKWAEFQVEAVNHALQGIPEDRVRFHICWGSWHGPHKGDVPLKDVVDLLLRVKAQAYPFEAGNVRHEHEWNVWKDTKVPEGKIVIPGVVSHATNVLEHPELVAERIVASQKVWPREHRWRHRLCLGGRVHPQIAWAKLSVFAEGAKLASQRTLAIDDVVMMISKFLCPGGAMEARPVPALSQ